MERPGAEPEGDKMIQIVIRAIAFAFAVVIGSVAMAALVWSPANAASTDANSVVSRAFDAAAAAPAASEELRAALTSSRGDRRAAAKTDRVIRTVTIEERTGNTSTLIRMPVAQVAQR
jgi:hypothetical protein